MDESLVTIVRSIIAFFTLLLFTRILGKQQVGQLSAFEYVSGITIGSMASSLSIDLSIKPLPMFIGLATWIILVFGLQFIAMKYRWFSKVINDQPTIVIQNGKILEQNLKKIRYRYDELMSHLREKNIFDVSHVEFALLETNGKLSVLKKPQYETVTPLDLNIVPSINGLMTEVIQDGVIIEQNLANRKITKEWVEQQLKMHGIKNIKEVSYGTVLPDGQLYVDKFDDAIKNINIGDFKGPLLVFQRKIRISGVT